jgi:hypothetical protein
VRSTPTIGRLPPTATPTPGQRRPRPREGAELTDRHFNECYCHFSFKTFLQSSVLRNCWVRGSAPPGAAGVLTSTGTSLLDYKRGVPVARPHGGSDGGRKEGNICELRVRLCPIVQKLLRVRHAAPWTATTSATTRFLPPPFFRVRCNCWVRGSAPPGAAGVRTSTGTSLLDYRRGVPVARPHGG